MGTLAVSGFSESTYRYEPGKAQKSAAVRSFADQAAEAAQAVEVWQAAEKGADVILHGAEEGTGEQALCAWADVVGGSSVTVYKTPDFDPENPVYKVKIWDARGNVTERMVNVAQTDPGDCDAAELFAFTSHLRESGKGDFQETVLKAVEAKAVQNAERKSAGSFHFLQRTDWLEIADDIMQSQYRRGNLKGYLEWKKFAGFFEQ